MKSIVDDKKIDSLITVRNELIKNLDNLNFVVKHEYDAKISGTTATKAVLSGFTRDLLYKEYENCIDHITKNDGKLYDDLDTSINFNSPTVTTNTLSEFLSVLLKETDKASFKDVFKVDTTIFDENTLQKIERKFNSFISGPIKDKKFKFKKLKNRKSEKELSYTFTEDVITDSNVITELKKLKSKNGVPVSGNKLNYYKP
jgi:hypothetical protein